MSYKFWHLVDETLNAILFILIGLEIIPVLQNFDISYIAIIALVIILVVVPEVLVFLCQSNCFQLKKHLRKIQLSSSLGEA